MSRVLFVFVVLFLCDISQSYECCAFEQALKIFYQGRICQISSAGGQNLGF